MRQKVSDKQLWEAINHANGVYTKARDYLKVAYGIKIAAVNIRERAIKKPELLEEIKIISINEAENGLKLLIAGAKNEAVKLKAIMFYLKTQGKDSGWTERKELEVDGNLTLKVMFVKSKSK